MRPHGHFHWNELATRDAEKAKAFYGRALGWTFNEMRMEGGSPPYWVCMAGETAVGGIYTMEGPRFEGVPEHWIGYVAVDDVDDRIRKAAAAGAAVAQPAFDIPGIGRIAIIKDSGGAVLGLITPAS